jgi:large subunit ribosomal protein L3
MKFILGRKLNMTQEFKESGEVIPVTVIQAGPCVITQVKTDVKDKYRAVQLGYGNKKKITKPLAGHLKNLDKFRYLREFRVDDSSQYKRGDKIDVSVFVPKELVAVCGISKGKGFQGVVKRHHFAGSPASHGHKDQLRMPGSSGPTFPQHVIKGRRMAGRMGGERVTVKNLEVVRVDKDKNLIVLKGAAPGARNGLLLIWGKGEMAKKEDLREKDQPKEEKKSAQGRSASGGKEKK